MLVKLTPDYVLMIDLENVSNAMNILSTEWNGNPVLISVETTDYPVEKILFPTVTTCREENEPNCFYFFSKLFDYLPFPFFDEG